MYPFSENYCDFQQFLLFQNKATHAGRSGKNAGNKPKYAISSSSDTVHGTSSAAYSHTGDLEWEVESTSDTFHRAQNCERLVAMGD